MSNPAASYVVASLVLGEGGTNVTCSNLGEAKRYLKKKTGGGSSFGILYYEDGEQPQEFLFVAKLVNDKIYLDEVKLDDQRHFVLQEEDGKLSIVAE